jgi:ABC-type multidrug transport system permease subunit
MSSRRSLSVLLGVAAHDARSVFKNPSALLLPPLLVPLFYLASFVGPLGGMSRSTGFFYYNYSAFIFVFVLVQAALFCGMFAALDIGRDYEIGLGGRLMIATPRRMAIVGGYALLSLVRGAAVMAVVWVVAVLTGMPVRGDVLDLVAINVLALLLCLAGVLCGAGIALRFQSSSAAILVLIPTFIVLFLTPLFEERRLLTGWFRIAADVNPLTAVIESGRGYMSHHPTSVGLAFAVAIGLVAAFSVFAVTGMRQAERGLHAR